MLWSSMQKERGDRGGKVDTRWNLIAWARFACGLGISAWWAHHMSQPGAIRAVALGGDIRWSDRTRDLDEI